MPDQCAVCSAGLRFGVSACSKCGFEPAGRRDGIGTAAPVAASAVVRQGVRKQMPFATSVLVDHLVQNRCGEAETVGLLVADGSARGESVVAFLVERELLAPGDLRDAMSKAFGLAVATVPGGPIAPSVIAAAAACRTTKKR